MSDGIIQENARSGHGSDRDHAVSLHPASLMPAASSQPEPELEARSILVIEDDPDISGLIRMHLQEQYQRVEIASDGISGYQQATEHSWDLILLDLRLPGKDGLQLCRQLRAEQNYVPVLMLTSKSSELDRVLGLESGADDYVTKPFSVIELMARIRAIFRRIDVSRKADTPADAEHGQNEILRSPDQSIELDSRRHKVTKHGQELDLTAKEFSLLSYFLHHPGSVFSRSDLLRHVWGYGHEGYEHTVNSHINRLRAKIEDNPTKPQLITTVWGVGYKLV